MGKKCKKCLLREDQFVADTEFQLLSQYIPYKIVRFIGRAECCIFEKKTEKFNGTVVYFDIIGFTPIVLNYINTNRDIADLSNTLSEFYSIIIETVRQFGGSVYQFAGDSLLICFDRMKAETERDNFNRTFAAMLRALELSDNYNLLAGKDNGFVLRPKIGISSGTIYQILLGTRDLFITPVILGNTVHTAVLCEKECKKQEIILSKEAWTIASAEGLQSNFTEMNGFYHLDKFPEDFIETVQMPEYTDTEQFFSNPYFYNRMATFINPIIRQQTKKSFAGFAGEYKNITCIMAKFEGVFAQQIGEEKIENSLSAVNEIYFLMQNKAYRYGGYCTKPDLSDKGVVFPIFFGTPSALENKERNAVLCAAEILLAAKKNTDIQSVNIGIGTGMVYSGEFGGFLRKDYTIIGNSVNFASRLMMHASEKGTYSVLIDEATKKSTESMCETKIVTGITCKGYDGVQTAYFVVKIKKIPQKKQVSSKLIGRSRELQQLCESFVQSASGRMNIVPVIGDAGMGKTYLVEQFVSCARQQIPDVKIYYGTCYQYEETTVFFCWRSIIKKLINMPERISDLKARDFTLRFFESYFPDEIIWIPIFLNMLGYDFIENTETSDIDVSIKQYHFFSLIERMFSRAAEQYPIVIILEDMQWCDSISLSMLEYLISSYGQKKVFITAISRELPFITGFFKQHNIRILKLAQLSDDASSALTEILLNMQEAEPILNRKIVATSEGNPFFIENIVHSLVESGTLIENESGKRILSHNIKSIQNIVIPSSIQNIILSRLSSLKFEEQVICKTASAIGKTFYSDCLLELLPDGISEKSVDKALSDFETHNIIVKEVSDDSEYSFTHGIIHDVIYDTILDTTKKELNLMILLYLEKRYEGNYQQVIEKLEYHALEAKAFDKVFLYAYTAAKKAEKLFSAQDTITHCLTALNAWNTLETPKDEQQLCKLLLTLAEAYRIIEDYEKARKIFEKVIQTCTKKRIKADALRGMGRCFQEQGKFDNAVISLEDALKILGKKAPKSLPAVYMDITKEAIIQTVNYGIRGKRIKPYSGEKLYAAETRTDILCILNKLYYFGLPEKIAWSSLVNFNNTLHCKKGVDKFCAAAGDYAVSLVSAGLTSLGRKIFEQGSLMLDYTQNLKTKNIFNARYAYYFLFYDDPVKSIHMLEAASDYFRKTGEQWELMTAEGALGQNYFLIGDFEKSIAGYEECDKIAKKLHSVMHIGWKYNKVPFMKYLRREFTGMQAEAQLQTGIKLSSTVHDHMTLCIHYGHLAYIASHEHNYDEALHYAECIIHENDLYKINIPHIKLSYVNAVESICEAFRHNAVPVKKTAYYKKLAKKALWTLYRLSKEYRMLAGPAARAEAIMAMTTGNKQKAAEWYNKSVILLKNSPYKWEYENTLSAGKEYEFYLTGDSL
ncbi:MAG: AAA family ATPase [Treponema sp.]|nr:AAA family ATPase [Treponema sp.]